MLKELAADFSEINTRTIENYLTKYEEELAQNGYEVLKGKRLKELKFAISLLAVRQRVVFLGLGKKELF